MKIESIQVQWLRIPLPKPVGFSVKTLKWREHLLVRVCSDEGVEGVGCCLQDISGGATYAAITELLAPLVVGGDPRDISKHWERMYWQTVRAGRRGNLLHGLSAVDIALWDHQAKLAKMPLYKLLGAYREEVPCYASGGYYYEGAEMYSKLEQEVAGYLALGFKAIKMKIGRFDHQTEARRVKLVRETIGPDVTLMVDPNQAYLDVNDCARAMHKIEPYDIAWLEEPLPVDMVDGHARLRQQISIPIATGEVEATRWAFERLVASGGVDYLQPDATMCGGISEWLKIAALAGAHGLSLAPHYHWDIHVHLGAATREVTILEKFVGTEVKNFDLVLREPLQAVAGMLRPPQRPGLGMDLDEEAVKRFTVAEQVIKAD